MKKDSLFLKIYTIFKQYLEKNTLGFCFQKQILKKIIFKGAIYPENIAQVRLDPIASARPRNLFLGRGYCSTPNCP